MRTVETRGHGDAATGTDRSEASTLLSLPASPRRFSSPRHLLSDDTRATQVCQILSGVTEAVAVHLHIVLTQVRCPSLVPGGALDRKGRARIGCRTSVRMVNAL